MTCSYYCTWAAQNDMLGRDEMYLDPAELEGSSGAAHARAFMNENDMLGDRGLAELYPEARGDLFFLLDDGWDVPLDIDPSDHISHGLLIPHITRFPSCTGGPVERLARLNEMCAAKGWAGLGIWIAAQESPMEEKALSTEKYWRERLEWSERAGIRYWKVDWGRHAGNVEFRRMLTDMGRVYAPGLMIEHARCMPCYNDASDGHNEEHLRLSDGRISESIVRQEAELLMFSDVLRTYDVYCHLSVAETIERASALLRAMSGRAVSGRALINCEDEAYLAASLGLCMGIMRHPVLGKYGENHPDCMFPKSKRDLKHRISEITAAVNWQRIMPPFSAAEGETRVSAETLTDSWRFSKGETWMTSAVGQRIEQSAPAAVSRGMPLPEVRAEGEKPFVTCACRGGCAAVAVHGRTREDDSWYVPQADVCVTVAPGTREIAVFGKPRSLTVRGTEDREVIVRSLHSGKGGAVRLEGGTFSGETLAAIGAAEDASDPAVRITVV